MPPRLIINADDFGLTRGINRAIAELYRAGALTSTTLMATGPAFDDAVALAQTLPGLGVGCHVVLVDGTPASLPSEIPTLLGSDKRTFRLTLGSFVRDLLLGRIDQAEIACEALAQIRHLQQAGIRVTHADTHKHTHLFPTVARPLIEVLEQTGIRTLRNPFEPEFARRVSPSPLLRRAQIAVLNRFQPAFLRLAQNARTTQGSLGVAATGTLDAPTLRRLLQSLPHEGTFELVCHPGYNDADLGRVRTRLRAHRETEYHALLSEIPRALTLPNPPRLIHYGELS
ncbi:MAG TPA: ChbG/HpnK family deacetylase [Granulicella sp.]